jgi:hypothetical protein
MMDSVSGLGELHIRNQLERKKEASLQHMTMMDRTLNRTRSTGFLAMSSTMSRNMNYVDNDFSGFIQKGPAKSRGEPKFIGAKANELSKWLNAESITRHREEMDCSSFTIRQVMKVDDTIDAKQMTKSQGASLGDDPFLGRNKCRDPRFKRRDRSWRPKKTYTQD